MTMQPEDINLNKPLITVDEIYSSLETAKGEIVPPYLIERCKLDHPLQLSNLDDTTQIARITNFGHFIPYMDEVLAMINTYMPSTSPNIDLEYFIHRYRILDDNRIVDLSTRWQGHTFLMFVKSQLVGTCITIREREVLYEGEYYTGKGFLVHTVTDPSIRRSYRSTLLPILTLKALANSGCNEIKTTTSITNLVSRNGSRHVFDNEEIDGEWARFTMYSTGKIDRFMNRLISSANLSEEAIVELTKGL